MKYHNTYGWLVVVFAILLATATAFAAVTTGYQYDDQYRLRYVIRSDGTTIEYRYDEAGNRTRKIVSATPVSDLTKPEITGFVVPPTSSSLTVTGIAISATDNVGVTGYLLTESSSTPSANDLNWSASVSQYTFTSSGSKTLYAWARDAAGNVSNVYTSQSVTVTVSENFSLAPTGAMSLARYTHTATLLLDGKVLIAGGFNLSSYIKAAEIFDPATGAFTVTGSMSDAHGSHTATLLPDGKVLIAGGQTGSGTLSSAELYDPATGLFSRTGYMTTDRRDHTATMLQNGKILITGGYHLTTTYPIKTAELYDPYTGTFTSTGSMTVNRYGHTATLLPNGKVLIAGGSSNTAYLNSAELYDPLTGTFTATANMSVSRLYAKATLLKDGNVLVSGGYNPSYHSSAELYDPDTDTFSATGGMATARINHTSLLLPNGKVLVSGGYNGSTTQSSEELFDPGTGSFSLTSAMSSPRQKHTATLLANSTVLIVGGYNSAGSGSVQSSADLLDIGTGELSFVGAPTGVTATGGNGSATVSFTAPAVSDGSTILYYTAVSAPGDITATGVTSPIVVNGLTNGTSYTFAVTAINAVGTGQSSATSNSVAPQPYVMPVIYGNSGVADVTLSYSDDTAKTVTSDTDGNYSFTVSYNWSGTVIPSKTGYTFSPVNKAYTSVIANQTAQNFTAIPILYTISGSAGVAGATLSYTDGTVKTATADASGNYAFAVSYNWSGTVTPAKTGYSFTPASRTYTSVLANQTAQNYTATSIILYTVTYNTNGATSGTAPATQTKTQGVNVTLASNSGTLAKTGYTFAGWNTATDGSGTTYSVGATYSTDAALTLYAKWTALPTYTVTYNANGATSGTAPATQTKTQGVNVTLASNSGTLAKTGYTFAGWNTAANGGGTTYAVGATYSTDTALTLYAKWLLNGSCGSSYGAAFTVAPSTNLCATGTPSAVIGTGPWTWSCGGGPSCWAYLQGTVVIPKTGQTACYDTVGTLISCIGTGQDADKRMGAAQSDPLFTDNGGSSITDKFYGMTWQKDVGANGATIPMGINGVPSERFTDSGDGTQTDNLTGLVWLKDAGCFATVGGITKGTDPSTSYLSWADALTWSNNLKSGDCSLSDGSVAGDWRLPNLNELVSLTTNYSAIPSDWLISQGFSGVQPYYWSSSSYAGITSNAWYVYNGGAYNFDKKRSHYYFVWPVRGGQSGSLGTLAISKDGTGTGSVSSNPAGISCGATCSASFAKGQSVVLTATADGGSSASWSGCDSTNANQCTVAAIGAKSVKATFTLIPAHTVTFNNNGGSGSMTAQSTNVATVLTANTFTRAGYTFAGWNTAAGGGGTSYADGASYPFTADVTLYAQWTALPTYTVTYNANGGSGTMTDASSPYLEGATVTVNNNTFTRSGYAFAGWYPNADGSGTLYGASFIMGAADVILYAKWTAATSTTFILPDTGQTKCYDPTGATPNEIPCAGTGQDGAYNINPMSYSDNGNGTITDNNTGLVWQKCSIGQNNDTSCSGTPAAYNWFQASGTYDANNNASTQSVCGELSLAGGGWRLPSINELESIFDYSIPGPGPSIQQTWFPNTVASVYWSSSFHSMVYDMLQEVYSYNYWIIRFSSSGWGDFLHSTNDSYVRCVRGGQ